MHNWRKRMHKRCPRNIWPWSIWHSTQLLEPFRIRDIYDICIKLGGPTEAPLVILKRIPLSISATNVQQFTSALSSLSRTFNEEQSGSSVLTPGLVRTG